METITQTQTFADLGKALQAKQVYTAAPDIYTATEITQFKTLDGTDYYSMTVTYHPPEETLDQKLHRIACRYENNTDLDWLVTIAYAAKDAIINDHSECCIPNEEDLDTLYKVIMGEEL